MPAVKEFLNRARIVILDSQLGARVAVRHSLMELGAQSNLISCSKTLADARRVTENENVSLVIADYALEDGLATSMLTPSRNFLFLLLSSNNSRAAVAKAAEDEVDEFLFKPYNQDDFNHAIENLIRNSLNPNEAERMLKKGITHFHSGEVEEAEECLHQAKLDSRTSSKAFAYLGQIETGRTSHEAAEKHFEQGLDSNQMHFRCLHGLFQTYERQERLEDAYRILKEIVVHFPESPERLSRVLYLAVKTDNLTDVEIYYNTYKLMTQKTPEVTGHLCSALAVAGRHHLQLGNTVQALLSFERALTVSQSHPKYVEYIARKLTEAGMSKECARLLGQFGISTLSSAA